MLCFVRSEVCTFSDIRLLNGLSILHDVVNICFLHVGFGCLLFSLHMLVQV